MDPWFYLQSTSAGVLGVAAGFLTIIVVSLFTGQSDKDATAFLDRIRHSRHREQ